ncbi:aminodeoxychorismate synthase component I [Novosphingobium terrae]|uniref:aminodeoxychorismate synthase component I n=1 Tax=Novosphingobium terrae TaxID=2726189 RepID=UPI001F12902B|nr:aminodeoxychorismate synthase component I [Novosphingobium terrae]
MNSGQTNLLSPARNNAAAGWHDVWRGPLEEPCPLPAHDTAHVILDDARGEAGGLLFHRPHEIVEAHALEEVHPALERIRDGVKRGYHAAGYLAYEAGFALEPRLTGLHRGVSAQPMLWFGLFDAPSAVRWPSPGHPPGAAARKLIPALSEAAYRQKVRDILALIEAGDCYQVNLTHEATLEDYGPPLERYLALRGLQQAGWGGMLSTGETMLQCFSPELFFMLHDQTLNTRPMKGTAPRGADAQEDAQIRERLRADPKERAENLMIVDLLRNDLSRVARPGSVKVDALFAIETYPTLHQMTSSISARLQAGYDAVDAIKRLFPCGSVTGAPKIRAMEIIAVQEQRHRGAYTGSMGYIAPDGSACFNVMIRTLVSAAQGGPISFGVGSGIVRDSDPAAEWAECHAKARFLTARPCSGTRR